MELKNTSETFQNAMNSIAAVASMTPEAVYQLWGKYRQDCHKFDQSASLVEFVDWYRADLGGDSSALLDAACGGAA